MYEASMRYQAEGTGLMVLAGKEYGTGSSRDWAAKGTMLLGVKAVIAESFERIHRSNLVGMGVLPLVFQPGESATVLGLRGDETFEIVDFPSAFASGFASGKDLLVRASGADGVKEFRVKARLDTPTELEYYRHGGVLQYVLRSLL
jgi:aconitate hydratase